MKRVFILILSLSVTGCIFTARPFKSNANSTKEKLIRFHVIANSDSKEDQRVKLEIRDAILNKMGPVLSKNDEKEESVETIEKNLKEIEKVANEILQKERKKYSARAEIGEFSFPVKSYGEITLPAGRYTALRVVLGDGGGKNWWCVMFPPLCFIDITKGLTTERTNEELNKVLNKDEVESITAFKAETNKAHASSTADIINEKNSKETKLQNEIEDKEESKLEFRFKSFEVVRNLFQRIFDR